MSKAKPLSKKKPVACVLVGLPGSGKSTWARKHPKKLPVASTDLFIESYARGKNISYADAFKKFYKTSRNMMKAQVEQLIAGKKPFIWDQVNHTKKERDAIYKILHATHEVHFVCFLVPLDICIARTAKRDRDGGDVVDENRIRFLAATATFPQKGDPCDKIVLFIHPKWKKKPGKT